MKNRRVLPRTAENASLQLDLANAGLNITKSNAHTHARKESREGKL